MRVCRSGSGRPGVTMVRAVARGPALAVVKGMTRRTASPTRTTRARRGTTRLSRPVPAPMIAKRLEPARAITRLGFQIFHVLPTPLGAPVIAIPRTDRSLRMHALVRASLRAA
jgi:hypothetical protein